MFTKHVIFSSFLILATTVSSAQADSNANLNAELKALQAKVAELEAKISKTSAAQGDSNSSASNPVTSSTTGIQFSGFVDSTYSYNFNSPSTGNNVARVFDHNSNSFNLNAAKIAIQKAVNAENPVGFRADLYAGDDAELIHSAGLGTSSESFDLEQAYAEVNVATSKLGLGINDIDLKLGKFVTLAGAEVIESKDNWNTSRGLLFGYAIPFAHTGARAIYTFDNSWDLTLGLNNGWDVADDNNDAKTLEAHLGFNNIALPADSSLTLALQGYVGPELAGDTGSQRKVGDVVATYKTPWKSLTLMYNFDYASQENGVAKGTTADWYGHAGYIRYDLEEDWSLSGRGEFFKDEDGYRVVAGTPANYREFTGTLEYRPWKGVITRLEYRNDHANKAVFDSDSGNKDNSQNTLGGEFIYVF